MKLHKHAASNQRRPMRSWNRRADSTILAWSSVPSQAVIWTSPFVAADALTAGQVCGQIVPYLYALCLAQINACLASEHSHHALHAVTHFSNADFLLTPCKVIVLRKKQHAVALLHPPPGAGTVARGGPEIAVSACTPAGCLRGNQKRSLSLAMHGRFRASSHAPSFNVHSIHSRTLRSRIGTHGQFQ
jgi:hypothetical protein